MDVLVVVVFLLWNGGRIEVKRYHEYEGRMTDEECEMMAYDVQHELLGGDRPVLVANAIKDMAYSCTWMS